jgi:hypothetical protein
LTPKIAVVEGLMDASGAVDERSFCVRVHLRLR